jgi:hypothetical protein
MKRIIYDGRGERKPFAKKITIIVSGYVEKKKYKVEDFGPEFGPKFSRDAGPADSFYKGAEVEYNVESIEREIAEKIRPTIESALGWRQKLGKNRKPHFGSNSLVGFPKIFESADYTEAMAKLNGEK